jgi:hypothetical protein
MREERDEARLRVRQVESAQSQLRALMGLTHTM